MTTAGTTSRRTHLVVAGAVVGLVALALVAFFVIRSTGGSDLDAAGRACGDVAILDDDGRTLEFDMRGKELGTGTGSWEQLQCVLDELKAPRRVTASMDNTRSVDGRQDAEWDDLTAEWSYHPDDGLDVIFSRD